MERALVDGRTVFWWPGAFSAAECRQLAAGAPWPDPAPLHGYQGFVLDASGQAFTRELSPQCSARMRGAPAHAWFDDLTLTVNQRLGWHVDPPRGATHKACVYVEAPEGTGLQFGVERPHAQVFGNIDEQLTVPCSLGTIVLFDIRLVHRARGTATGPRRVLGLRATVEA